MRSYSSAVMLCWASNCGVTATGEGTTAEEAGFITVASIVARHSHTQAAKRMWKGATKRKLATCDADQSSSVRRQRQVSAALCRESEREGIGRESRGSASAQ